RALSIRSARSLPCPSPRRDASCNLPGARGFESVAAAELVSQACARSGCQGQTERCWAEVARGGDADSIALHALPVRRGAEWIYGFVSQLPCGEPRARCGIASLRIFLALEDEERRRIHQPGCLDRWIDPAEVMLHEEVVLVGDRGGERDVDRLRLQRGERFFECEI